jgi:peptidyl-prolyl cis-trans isomerase SurA
MRFRPTSALLFLAVLPVTAQRAIVVDRIAVVVGTQVIKTSDIERELRVTALLNQSPLDLSVAARRAAAERLVDQQIIRQELVTGAYSALAEGDAAGYERQFVRDHFGGSRTRFRRALAEYGITEQQLLSRLTWQLRVASFINERFRVGVLVSDEDVRQYYDQHADALRRQNPGRTTLAELTPVINNVIAGQRVSESYEAWLDRARKRARIEYKQDAFA